MSTSVLRQNGGSETYFVSLNLQICRKRYDLSYTRCQILLKPTRFHDNLREAHWTDSRGRIHIHATDQRPIVSFCGWPTYHLSTRRRLKTFVFRIEITVHHDFTWIGFTVYRDRYSNSLPLNHLYQQKAFTLLYFQNNGKHTDFVILIMDRSQLVMGYRLLSWTNSAPLGSSECIFYLTWFSHTALFSFTVTYTFPSFYPVWNYEMFL